MNQPTVQTFHGFPVENHEAILASRVSLVELEEKPLNRVDADVPAITRLTDYIECVVSGNCCGSINIIPGDAIAWLGRGGGMGRKCGEISDGPPPLFVLLKPEHHSLPGCTRVTPEQFRDDLETMVSSMRRPAAK